jgi:hypothetical protein
MDFFLLMLIKSALWAADIRNQFPLLPHNCF